MSSDNIAILWLQCYCNSNLHCVACCQHPANPYCEPRIFVDEPLLDGVEQFIDNQGNSADEYLIAGNDSNILDCGKLETCHGLVQIVNKPNHGVNILDIMFTDIHQLTVFLLRECIVVEFYLNCTICVTKLIYMWFSFYAVYFWTRN